MRTTTRWLALATAASALTTASNARSLSCDRTGPITAMELVELSHDGLPASTDAYKDFQVSLGLGSGVDTDGRFAIGPAVFAGRDPTPHQEEEYDFYVPTR